MAQCFGCVCFIFLFAMIACVLLGVGTYYLDVGESEYIDTQREIDRMDEEMVEYPLTATKEQLRKTDVEVVYFGKLQSDPETPMTDQSFPQISSNGVQLKRNAQIWGVIETKKCETYYVTTSCRTSSSTNGDYHYSTTRRENYIDCIYSYSTGFTNNPQPCHNTYWSQPYIDTSGSQYSSFEYCNSHDNPRRYYRPQKGQEYYQETCNKWNSRTQFQGPCPSGSCTTTNIASQYEFGLFTVHDPYIVQKYVGDLDPPSHDIQFDPFSIQSWITCEQDCSAGKCTTIYSSNQVQADICDRVSSGQYDLGDQKISWINWPGEEELYTCTKQEYHGNDDFELVQASIEGEGSDAENFMDVDFDIVKRTKLTKDICIDMYTEANSEKLWDMRYLSGLCLIFSCVYAFCSFAAAFDTFTDLVFFFPELVSEALCCGANHISWIFHWMQDCLDCGMWIFCSCLGGCVGIVFFMFVFAIIYVRARAGNFMIFVISSAILALVCVFGMRFVQAAKRKHDESDDEQEEILLDQESSPYDSKPVFEQPNPNEQYYTSNQGTNEQPSLAQPYVPQNYHSQQLQSTPQYAPQQPEIPPSYAPPQQPEIPPAYAPQQQLSNVPQNAPQQQPNAPQYTPQQPLNAPQYVPQLHNQQNQYTPQQYQAQSQYPQQPQYPQQSQYPQQQQHPPQSHYPQQHPPQPQYPSQPQYPQNNFAPQVYPSQQNQPYQPYPPPDESGNLNQNPPPYNPYS